MQANGLGLRHGAVRICDGAAPRRYDAGLDSAPTEDPATRLAANITALEDRIEAARRRSPRAADAVELIVVTKAQPQGIFAPLAAAGVRIVGENRVQAAAERRPAAPEGLIWHGIGHLQRNKAALAVATFDVFHALDSLRLAARLDEVLEGSGRSWPVYVQVNAAEDPAKGGFAPSEVPQTLEALTAYPHLTPIGFMTMAKQGAEESDLRRTFSTLGGVRDEAVRRGVGSTAPYGLSMGMSNDFEIAVEEGATAVRVGRAVFADVSMEGAGDGVRRADAREPS